MTNFNKAVWNNKNVFWNVVQTPSETYNLFTIFMLTLNAN